MTAVPVAVAAPALPAVVPLVVAPACATDDGHDFPVTARITDGPDTYAAGDDPATWQLDLTNTTSRACARIHPVVVLVDDEQTLTPDRPRMEFSDGTRTHAVSFQETELHELIGVFADDDAEFPGFTVGARETVRVPVDLAFADGTSDHRVVASAAVVQRGEDDGEWVGQSGEYRFQVTGDSDEGGGGEERGQGAGGELARTGAAPATPAVRFAAAGSAVCLFLGAGLLLAAHEVRRARRPRSAP